MNGTRDSDANAPHKANTSEQNIIVSRFQKALIFECLIDSINSGKYNLRFHENKWPTKWSCQQVAFYESSNDQFQLTFHFDGTFALTVTETETQTDTETGTDR